MLVWKIACLGLLLLGIGLLIYICRMKKQLRDIVRELEANRELSYNRQMQVDLFDRDLTDMATELNHNLDFQKQLKLEAEKAEKNIRQSVSDIAHDLRTPLTVIKGNLQMLQMEVQLSEKATQYLNICVQKTDEMRTMADDFFQLSVLESDLESVERKRVDLTAALLQFLAEQEAVIVTRGLEPQVIFPEKSLFVLADEKLLVRMFGNLLNNVMRHAKGSTFQIILQERDTEQCEVVFANAVEPGETLDTTALFDRTYRGSRARSGSGAGLGLYIVKLLARKQDASVSADIRENVLSIRVKFPQSK